MVIYPMKVMFVQGVLVQNKVGLAGGGSCGLVLNIIKLSIQYKRVLGVAQERVRQITSQV